MVDEPEAREIAKATFETGDVVLGDARELNDGWFFPCVTKNKLRDLLTGVIVNKQNGRYLRVWAHLPMGRDLSLYDRGYHFAHYDLVVLAVEDTDETVGVLHALHEVVTDTYYRNDRVYRVGRNLTEAEVRKRLSSLPCVFSGRFEPHIDLLEQARQAGWFTFKTFEYRGKK